MFCPKNGSILMPKKDGTKSVMVCREGGKITTECKVCGYKPSENKAEIKEAGTTMRKIEVIEKVETHPKVRIKCPKCAHKIAYYWTQQTRGADEPETRFFRCTKCNHTWREYA